MNRSDFFNNIGGLNSSDSAFMVNDNQCIDGNNFEYSKKGAIVRSRDKTKVNAIADTQTYTHGAAIHNTASGVKTFVRFAGTKLQTVDIDNAIFTNVSNDTATPGSDFFSATSQVPAVGVNFNNNSANTLWVVGAGAANIIGYNGTSVTTNGVSEPSGTFTAVVGSLGGAFDTVGTYYYALVLRKTSTQALSNAALDQVAVIANTTDHVTLTFPTGVDATLYDEWYIYRSAVGGVSDFTTGILVAQVAVGTTNYVDNGDVAVDFSAEVVPRAGGTTDNSVLPTGTYKTIVAFKRQLITSLNSTVYFSDFDKPESWPIDKNVTIPTGGPITAIGVIGFNAPITSNVDEYLVVFKESEMWVITGSGALDNTSGIYDLLLQFVDSCGCPGQALIVPATGYIAWIDIRGPYVWGGAGKPIYIGRTIEDKFGFDGDIDKSKLYFGFGRLLRQKNQIVWYLSHRTKGENKYLLKLDLRLTVPSVGQALNDTIMEGVFAQGSSSISIYGGVSYLVTSNTENFIIGDSLGFLYRMFYSYDEIGNPIDFYYETKNFDLGVPTVAKQIHKIVVWVDESSSNDLTLYYWTNYLASLDDRSQLSETMENKREEKASIWDMAIWDVSRWDEYANKPKGLIYNLNGQQNNNSGDAVRLRFVQTDAISPVTIHGFSIYWSEIATRK